MKNVDWGWHGRTRKLRKRGEYLLQNMSVPADVVFRFERDGGKTEEVPAHKIFLAIGSEVFHAMFYGPAADRIVSDIAIPNYTKEVFGVWVGFLYTDRAPDLRMENAMEVLECAQQYGLPELAALCNSLVCQNLSKKMNMVMPVLAKARSLDEPEIQKCAMDLVDERTLTVLSTENFLDVDGDLLLTILQRSELQVEPEEEIDVYRAAYRWASKRTSDPSGNKRKKFSEQRAVLGKAFCQIRFPLMTPAQFLEGPVKDGMFAQSELPLNNDPSSSNREWAELGFSSATRASEKEADRAKLTVDVRSECGCDECGRHHDGYAYDYNVSAHFRTSIIADFRKCPETSRRFMELYQKDYGFGVCCGSLSRDALGCRGPLSGPLPDAEKGLLGHDRCGTDALRRVSKEVEQNNGYHEPTTKVTKSFFTLVIFTGKDDSEFESGDVVFGRLAGWEDFHALKGIQYKQTFCETFGFPPHGTVGASHKLR